MSVVVGFCGPHRTGKSTLAKKWADKNGFFYVDANVSGALAQAGFDSSNVASLPLERFIRAQTVVLDRLVNLSYDLTRRDVDNVYVLDRTPLDALMYFRAYLGSQYVMELTKPIYEDIKDFIMRYIRRAKDELSRNFSLVVVLRPGIPIVKDSTKAPADDLFLNQLTALLMGDVLTITEEYQEVSPCFSIVPKDMISLDDRVAYVDMAYKLMLNRAMELRELIEAQNN